MDAIRNQWHFFQNEEIPEEWYVNQQAEKPTSSRHQESLSHGNSTPERGFSVNKQLLAVYGYSTYEDTIIALPRVKDELLHVGGILVFPITPELLDSVSASWSKYEADCLARPQAENAERKKRAQMMEENERRIVAEKQVAEIDDKIVQCKSNISVQMI